MTLKMIVYIKIYLIFIQMIHITMSGTIHRSAKRRLVTWRNVHKRLKLQNKIKERTKTIWEVKAKWTCLL